MRHVMLDLETWGTRPGCALRSIGACAFSLDRELINQTFYMNVDEASCLAAGLEKDRSTVEWWEKQSLEARAHLMIDPRPLVSVVRAFHGWFREIGGEFVWGHGANFDEPIWVAAAHAVGERVPWKFWNARCTRTLYHAADFDPRSIPRSGTHHDAGDDAHYQARCVIAAAKKLLAWRYGPPPPIVTNRERAPHMTSDEPPNNAAGLAPENASP